MSVEAAARFARTGQGLSSVLGGTFTTYIVLCRVSAASNISVNMFT